jgi:hypothetical protein
MLFFFHETHPQAFSLLHSCPYRIRYVNQHAHQYHAGNEKGQSILASIRHEHLFEIVKVQASVVTQGIWFEKESNDQEHHDSNKKEKRVLGGTQASLQCEKQAQTGKSEYPI